MTQLLLRITPLEGNEVPPVLVKRMKGLVYNVVSAPYRTLGKKVPKLEWEEL